MRRFISVYVSVIQWINVRYCVASRRVDHTLNLFCSDRVSNMEKKETVKESKVRANGGGVSALERFINCFILNV